MEVVDLYNETMSNDSPFFSTYMSTYWQQLDINMLDKMLPWLLILGCFCLYMFSDQHKKVAEAEEAEAEEAEAVEAKEAEAEGEEEEEELVFGVSDVSEYSLPFGDENVAMILYEENDFQGKQRKVTHVDEVVLTKGQELPRVNSLRFTASAMKTDRLMRMYTPSTNKEHVIRLPHDLAQIHDISNMLHPILEDERFQDAEVSIIVGQRKKK